MLQVGNGTTSPLVSVLPEDAEADLLFRTSPSDALQGVVAAQLAAGELIDGYKFAKVSTIYINNPYGQGLSNAFAAAFKARGGEVLAEVAHPEEVQPTYRSQLQAALQGEPDLLLAADLSGAHRRDRQGEPRHLRLHRLAVHRRQPVERGAERGRRRRSRRQARHRAFGGPGVGDLQELRRSL